MKKLLLSLLLFMACEKKINENYHVKTNEVKQEVNTDFTFKQFDNKCYYTFENKNFYVRYDIPKINIHTNGYVVIQEILYSKNDTSYKFLNEYSNIYTKYIENINYKSTEIFKLKDNFVNLEDIFFQGIFRTCEAMIMAQIKYKTETINKEEVIEMRDKMENRKSGLMLNQNIY